MPAFKRKYATATTVYFPLIALGTVNFTSTATLTTADMKISIDGGAFTVQGTAIANLGSYGYSYTCTTGNLTGKIAVLVVISTAATKVCEDTMIEIETYGNAAAQHVFDLSVANQTVIASAGTVMLAANALSAGAIVANAFSGGAFAANWLTVGGIAVNALSAAGFGAGFISSGGIAASAISVGHLSTGCISSVKFAAGAVDSAAIGALAFEAGKFAAGFLSAGGVAANALSAGAYTTNWLSVGGIAANAISVGGINTGVFGTIADYVWDEVTSGHLTTGTFGLTNKIIRDGTAQAGGAASITLDAGASAGTADIYTGSQIYIYGGVGSAQGARVIVAYNSNTKVATVAPAWTVAPDLTSLFIITPQTTGVQGTDYRVLVSGQAHTAGNLVTVGTISAGAIGANMLSAGAFAANWLSVGGIATGALSAGGFGAGFISSGGIAASAISVGHISTGAIAAGGIAANALSAGAFAANWLSVGGIAVNALSPAGFAAGFISAGGIAANAITVGGIASAVFTTVANTVWATANIEPTAPPAVTAPAISAVSWLLALSLNKITQTATSQKLFSVSTGTLIATAVISDDATTFTRNSFN